MSNMQMQPRCVQLRPSQHRRTTARTVRARRCAVQATGSEQHKLQFRVRRARLEDAQAVADLYSEVFGAGNFPGYEDNEVIQQVEARYASAVGRESSNKLAEALANKAEAALAHRTYRVTREAAMLAGRLRMAQGLPATFPTEGPAELRQLSKWRRARSFVCLLVEEAEAADAGGQPGRLLGTATLSLMQAEAALPPPFPSSAPLRAYISNMAVLPQARRQGIATALVGACGRIGEAARGAPAAAPCWRAAVPRVAWCRGAAQPTGGWCAGLEMLLRSGTAVEQYHYLDSDKLAAVCQCCI
ncbi:hypothetical protein COO60DRAFT_193031 [Scenedesmus sp. NREL 46B-D3]|nr:hypothetical protein COO60DRAFT_193031 [Scenedesmus sp. NREL 46B-D3]